MHDLAQLKNFTSLARKQARAKRTKQNAACQGKIKNRQPYRKLNSLLSAREPVAARKYQTLTF